MSNAAEANQNPEPTLQDLAYQAASSAKLNSFAHAFVADPAQAGRLAATLSKDYPDATRLANLCDSGLVNQMAFLVDVPGSSPLLSVLSCPFPTARGADAVFAGSLGDAMDIICPVTIRMRDVKGQCITLAKTKRDPLRFTLAISTSDPLTEEAPEPTDEGAFAPPPGPDRLGLDIQDPADEPCIVLLPKIFPLAGGYSIPHSNSPTPVTTTESLRNTPGAPNLDEFHMWYEGMRYGVTNLSNYSIQARDTLFTYAQLDSAPFTPETNLVSRFTITVNFLNPIDPLYKTVTDNVLDKKWIAFLTYGSKLSHNFGLHTPPKAKRPNELETESSPSDVQALILGLTTAITSSKTMTSTEREQASEVAETQAFYEILFATIANTPNEDGTTTKTFKKASIEPVFLQVLKANKNSKATKLLQTAIETIAAEMNCRENRFASASNLKAELFDHPLTAAIRSATWEHRHTVLHPEGIKTHFGFHHLAPPRTWTVEYKTRLEGATKVVQQEQVEEDTSRTSAKATDIYHLGRMQSINDINEMIGNFYCLMHMMIKVDPDNPPTVWTEIAAFDLVMRSSEGRKWFEQHRSVRELLFNVIQDIQSTVAGFVSVARQQGYHAALLEGNPIAHEIFDKPQLQGKQLRRNLQSTILTMQAGPYKEASFVFTNFQPPETRKRNAPNETGETSNTRTRTNTSTSTNHNEGNNPSGNQSSRIPRTATTPRPNPAGLIANTPPPATAQGKTILKQLATDATARLLHPGPIFPHPNKPTRFTLMCCRSAYEGKTCAFEACNFFHFPNNLNTVSADIKTKLVAWVATQPSVEWTAAAANWAALTTGNSSQSTTRAVNLASSNN